MKRTVQPAGVLKYEAFTDALPVDSYLVGFLAIAQVKLIFKRKTYYAMFCCKNEMIWLNIDKIAARRVQVMFMKPTYVHQPLFQDKWSSTMLGTTFHCLKNLSFT